MLATMDDISEPEMGLNRERNKHIAMWDTVTRKGEAQEEEPTLTQGLWALATRQVQRTVSLVSMLM